MITQTQQEAHTHSGHGGRRALTSAGLAVAAAGVALTLLMLLVRGASAQADQPLVPGAPATGTLTSRFGDAWQIYACAGDILTVTAASDAFSPFIELYGAGQEAPMIDAGGDLSITVLASAPLTETGIYTIAVLGERLSARGPYTLSATLVATHTDALTDTVALEVADFYIAAGQSLTGTIASRFGDLWQMHICGGAPVTLTVSTSAFVPVLIFAEELSGTLALTPTALESTDQPATSSLLPSTDEATRQNPELSAAAVFTPSLTMDLQVTVGGERRSDRGPYTLIAEAAPLTATATTTPAEGTQEPPAPTATQRNTATPARQPTATPSPIVIPSCNVLVQTLRLRSGPGTEFEPPLGGLPSGTTLELFGRNADGDWLNVRVQGSALVGWVSAGAEFVQCNVPIGGLPVLASPPTPTAQPTARPTARPTATATATNTPIPLPTPQAFVIVPGTGSDGDVTGSLRTGADVGFATDGRMVFTNALWFFADATPPDGRTIQRVEFDIRALDEANTLVFSNAETTPAYCLFGGGTPDCAVLRLSVGTYWPAGSIPIFNQLYQVTTSFFLNGGDPQTPDAQWFATMEIDSPNLTPPITTLPVEPTTLAPRGEDIPTPTPTPTEEYVTEPPEIQVELREVGPGSTALEVNGTIVFQVAAWDPAVGTYNGDGIDYIRLALTDSSGTVYARDERVPAYCAFAGGEPDCNIYDYAAAGYVWESGAPVEVGTLVLTADVFASDGRVVNYRWDIQVN